MANAIVIEDIFEVTAKARPLISHAIMSCAALSSHGHFVVFLSVRRTPTARSSKGEHVFHAFCEQ
jgi:CRISPR/Cas system-associated endonuclease Cas1